MTKKLFAVAVMSVVCSTVVFGADKKPVAADNKDQLLAK